MIFAPAPVTGQDGKPGTSEVDDPAAAREADASGVDPCAHPEVEDEEWVDALRERVYRTVCGSARWFDSFFGDMRAFDETNTTHGWLSTHLIWSEYDDFTFKGRFRAKVYLPNVNERLSLFVGRVPEDEFFTDSPEDGDQIPGGFQDVEENDWLVGFGYLPVSSKRSRFNISVGVKAAWPLEPYAKARYRYLYFLSDNRLLRTRLTLFWVSEEGAGITPQIDYDHRMGRTFMSRWSNSVTFSETTEGAKWWSSLTLFQDLGEGRAMSYKTWIRGETEAPVEIEEVGLYVLFRKSIKDDWLFLEIGPGITWPRYETYEVRERSLGFTIGLEMQYGDKP